MERAALGDPRQTSYVVPDGDEVIASWLALEFIDAGGSGFHHVAYWPRDFDEAERQTEFASRPTVQSGPVRFSDHTVSGPPEMVVEIMEVNDRLAPISEAVREAAASWDGATDPVRSYPPGSQMKESAAPALPQRSSVGEACE